MYSIVRRFFKDTARSYDTIVKITTFNRDKAWKEYMLSLLPYADYCLDLACGTGILSNMLKAKARIVIGLDLMYDNLLIAKDKHLDIIQGAAEHLPFKDDTFDIITASYLAKYCDPKLTIKECARVLKDDGVIVMHDFTYPKGIIRLLWHLYFLILKFVGLFTPSWKIIFDELDKVIMASRWVDDIRQEMIKHGFKDIKIIPLTFNTATIIYARLDKV